MGKRNSQLQELTVVAQNDYLTIVDTSAGQSKRVSVKTLVGSVDIGWVATGESWTFSAWTTATRVGVVTVPSDATTKYTPGMRVRFSQTTGGTKYGIIHAVTATTLAIFFPEGTTFVNETITSPVFSALDTPYGFPRDRNMWRLRFASVTGNTANTPAKATWYKPLSTAQLTLGTGKWSLGYRTNPRGAGTSSSWVTQKTTLSTTTNSETLAESTTMSGGDSPANGLLIYSGAHVAANISIEVTGANPTYHLLHLVDSQGPTQGSCGIVGNTYIEAFSAYI